MNGSKKETARATTLITFDLRPLDALHIALAEAGNRAKASLPRRQSSLSIRTVFKLQRIKAAVQETGPSYAAVPLPAAILLRRLHTVVSLYRPSI